MLEHYPHLDAHVMRFVERMVSWAGMNRGACEAILATAADMNGFPERFHAAGREWQARAAEAEAAGRHVTAGDWYFMAFCCYRVADFFYSKDGSGRFDAYDASVDCFHRGTRYFAAPPEAVTIELDGRDLPGYLVVPATAPKPCPAVVAIHGADGTKEDHYWGTVMPAVRRGLAVLIADGPGQGATLRRLGIPARFDTEAFGRRCVDVLAADPRVDAGRIGIVGTSFGGYSGTRAFALDRRVKACLAISGLYDVVEGLWAYRPIRPQLAYNLGAASEAETLERLRAFTLKGLLEAGDRPLAIFHGGADPLIPPSQAQAVYDHWGGPKTLVIWPGAAHNLHDVAFQAEADMWDWVSEALSS
jgi:dipeptidyl aminopeptidase/acylaminoacyl peptidase